LNLNSVSRVPQHAQISLIKSTSFCLVRARIKYLAYVSHLPNCTQVWPMVINASLAKGLLMVLRVSMLAIFPMCLAKWGGLNTMRLKAKPKILTPKGQLGRQWKVTVFYTFCIKRRVRIFCTKYLYGNDTWKLHT
jgi:hypothetical protein